ncbi:MAG: folate-binding protein YgfZ [Micromonosporaceae bacterium]|nr:folate-binding protein YgfZ [Micromonosporaceae bacterium]
MSAGTAGSAAGGGAGFAVPGAVAVEAIDPADLDRGVAAHYGDPVREQRQLAAAAGVVDRSNRGVLAIAGEDRLTWLHSLTTQHLSGLPPMTGTELLVLSPHGHVEHHAVVLDDGTTTFLDVEPGTAGALLEFLTRMRFLMRVEPAEVTDAWAVLSVVGPASAEAVARLGVPSLEPPVIAPVPGPKFASGAVAKAASARYAVAAVASGGYARRMPYGFDLLVPRSTVSTVVDSLGLRPAGLWAFEALRVADRRPRLGKETDHRTLPAEVGWLAGAVHLDKGCYRGQETVARVHNLGRPPRRLVLLHLDGISTDELPAPGTPVTTDDGRAVGFVGTAARHYELGPVALAVVKRTVPDDATLRVGPATAAIDTEPDGAAAPAVGEDA